MRRWPVVPCVYLLVHQGVWSVWRPDHRADFGCIPSYRLAVGTCSPTAFAYCPTIHPGAYPWRLEVVPTAACYPGRPVGPTTVVARQDWIPEQVDSANIAARARKAANEAAMAAYLSSVSAS